MGKRILDALVTAFAIIFVVPTGLVLASWNAIPGDSLYSIKSGLEDATLIILSGTPLVPEMSARFTDRRFEEATQLLEDKGSSVGYDLLIAEAQQTQNYIFEKSDVQGSVQFTQNIEKYQEEISKKKIEVQSQIKSQPTSQAPAPTSDGDVTTKSTPAPTTKPVEVKVPSSSVSDTTGQVIVVNKPETVVIREEEPEELLEKLETAEEELEEIKQEVKHRMPQGNSDQNKDKDKKEDKDKDKRD